MHTASIERAVVQLTYSPQFVTKPHFFFLLISDSNIK